MDADDDDDTVIPESDSDFDAFAQKLIGATSRDPERYGLTQEEVAALRVAHEKWLASCAKAEAAEAALDAAEADRAAITTKGGKDSDLFRPVGWVTPASGKTMRAASTPPRSRPAGRVERYGAFAILIRIVDEQDPEAPRFPEGARVCEIRTYIGESAPTSAASYTFLAEITRSPYVDQHEPDDTGKRVFYILRWRDERGAPGPWSVVVTAMIPGAQD